MKNINPALMIVALAALVMLPIAATPAHAGACTESTHAMFNACKNDVKDDYFEGLAICMNLSDPNEREECFEEVAEERMEAREECASVARARRELCDQIGEGPYDPDFDPGDYLPTKELFNNDNDYFPLAIGNEWHYEGDGEVVDVMVVNASKNIEGVTCIVVNDKVFEVAEEAAEGELVEDTDDWYAQNYNGSVHYCGEIARDYETFEGDLPDDPELVSIDGSFKHGRDGAKHGVLMPGTPVVGDVYRQEFALGDAEDVGEILSTSYVYGVDPDLDQFVPATLATHFCSIPDPCIVTRDSTPLEPDTEERKYYAKYIGPFLEVNLEDEEILELVDCSFALCSTIP